MIKYLTLILIIFLPLFNSFGQNRCKVRVNGKYGYIDTLGNIKIEPIYSYANQFSEGYAVVSTESKAGFIDTAGHMVIPEQFEGATYFKDGRAIVRNNGKYGVIDAEGNWIVDCIYDWITPALNNEGRIGFKQNGTWGYLDLNGEVAIENKFGSISMFHNGTARVNFIGNYGVIDTLGNYILEPKYVVIRGESFFNDRIGVRAKEDKKFKYLDSKGNQITEALFYQVSSYSEGAAFVTENFGELGYFIDTDGNKLFEAEFEYGGPFKNGLAVVKKGKYGIIDKQGQFLVPPELDGIRVFNESGFFVYWERKGNKNRYGLINLKGQFITKPIYSSTLINDGDCVFPELYKNGKDSYDFNTKLGYVNREGIVIWRSRK